MPGTNPPPGWYPDATGHPRWWTGTVWGAYAPVAAAPPGPAWSSAPAGPPPYPGAPPGARSDATTLAMLAHLGMLVGGFIVPLIIYLTTGKDDPFVRHHSSEALNFSITYVIASFGLMFCFFFGFIWPPLLIFVFLGFFAVIIAHFVWLVMASVKAYHGEWWRYPINFRFVPGENGVGAVPR